QHSPSTNAPPRVAPWIPRRRNNAVPTAAAVGTVDISAVRPRMATRPRNNGARTASSGRPAAGGANRNASHPSPSTSSGLSITPNPTSTDLSERTRRAALSVGRGQHQTTVTATIATSTTAISLPISATARTRMLGGSSALRTTVPPMTAGARPSASRPERYDRSPSTVSPAAVRRPVDTSTLPRTTPPSSIREADPRNVPWIVPDADSRRDQNRTSPATVESAPSRTVQAEVTMSPPTSP